MKNAAEAVFAGLVGLAMFNIFFFAPNTPGVIGSIFGGATNLFGTLVTPGSNQGNIRVNLGVG